MFYQMLLWLFAIASYFIVNVHTFEMNMTEYYKMPKLYDFDDYDRCLHEYNNLSTYCFVRADVIPKANSEAWRAIVDISKYNKHHFNHRHLYFGICVSWCEAALAAWPGNFTKELYAGILTNNSKVNTYVKLFSGEDVNRQRYNRLVNQCINLRLKERHDLQAESMIEYCDSSHKIIEEDIWNLTFYTVVCTLIFLATLSSFYDFYLKHKRNDKVLTDRDHYKSPPNSIVSKFGVVFSIPRNWYRLNQEPNGKIGRDLRFLDCFKFFSMFLVIFAHSNWVVYESAIDNPQDPERLLHTAAGTLLISGALITITFFVISGFLLTVTWLSVTKTNDEMTRADYMDVFIKFNVFRYLRLTAPYAFVMLMSGVYFDNPGGPMWRHIFEREQLSCRKNWWSNILYINNYVNNNERCLLQSWYLAADTHSFITSLLLLMVAHKWPKIRKYLYGSLILIFVLVPGIVTYLNKYNALFIPTPQTQRDSFVDDSQFADFYAPFHMNFGCYFAGVFAALIYDHLTTKQFNLRQYKLFHVVWYALIPLGVLWMLSAHPMFQNYYEEPTILWNSVYAAVQRNAWACGLALFIIGMAAKVGWIFRKFACLPIFKLLGRLTYGTFILHLLVARMVLATIRQPIYFGTGMMFAFVIFTMTVSYLLSFLLAIFVELPMSSFLKIVR